MTTATSPEQFGAAGVDRPHLLMSAPDFFEVSYRINPWMEPESWLPSAPQLAAAARRDWGLLKATCEQLGATVEVQPAVRGLPDMVFTANAAMVLDRRVLLARFAHAERRGEEVPDRALFDGLLARGSIDEIILPPQGLYFEGAGDAHWDAQRAVVWVGYGQRTSRDIGRVIGEIHSVATAPLELVDPRFYHLDTCFCLLTGGEAIYYPPALSAAARAILHERIEPHLLIEASDEDAHHLAVNAVCLGRDVVTCHASALLRAALAERGYRVHIVPLDSFNRAGGAAYCLTLRLDLRIGQ